MGLNVLCLLQAADETAVAFALRLRLYALVISVPQLKYFLKSQSLLA